MRRKMVVQKLLSCLTSTMFSVPSVPCRTAWGTCIAADGVSAAVSSATTSVVCRTFVDIYIIMTTAGLCSPKVVYLAYHVQVIPSPVSTGFLHHLHLHIMAVYETGIMMWINTFVIDIINLTHLHNAFHHLYILGDISWYK